VPLVLNTAQFADFHKRLAERFRPAVIRGIMAGAARAIPYLVDRTRTAPPANPGGVGSGGAVNTGALVRGWRVLAASDGASIVNVAAHAVNVEEGRRRGSKFPPRDPLIAWIKRKLLTKPKKKPRRFAPRSNREAEREARDRRRLEAAIRRVGAKDPKYGPRQQKPDSRRARVRRKLSTDEQAARLYFPIARAIARRGLIARKLITAPEAGAEILRLVSAAVVAELEKETAR
jgi:hypothetical protein